jgi:hypothetical protein
MCVRLTFNCQGETRTSVRSSLYVIVVLLDDGQYKRPKRVVEGKRMHSFKVLCSFGNKNRCR